MRPATFICVERLSAFVENATDIAFPPSEEAPKLAVATADRAGETLQPGEPAPPPPTRTARLS